MKHTDLSYIAGIIDGEGSISLCQRGKPSKRMGHCLSISVVNTNEWICQWLHFNFGGCLRVRSKTLGWNKRPIWEWSIESQKALSFLELIVPYLRIKRPQAELAIQFQRYKRRGHTLPEDRILEEAQRILMKSFNSGKGKSRDEAKQANHNKE